MLSPKIKSLKPSTPLSSKILLARDKFVLVFCPTGPPISFPVSGFTFGITPVFAYSLANKLATLKFV